VAVGLIVVAVPATSVQPLRAEAPAVAATGLARGARGEAVRSLQQALVNQGIAVSGGVDGIFGSGTETAVKQFQSRQGITQSGVVDDATALALGLASSPLLGLTQGVRGDPVRSLQQALVAAGIDVPGGVDGVFGPGTKAALQQFQTARGSSPTGTVDVVTAAALGSVSASSGSSTSGGAQPAATAPSDATASLVGLKIGSRGDPVKALQRQIIASGFPVVGGADGVFGVLTANALRSFQNANGLGVTGVVDAATAAALGKAAAPASGGSTSHDPTVSSPLVGLRYGAIGSDVKALQQAMLDAGISVRGGADGVFGTATLSALKTFQTGRGLEASGVVDAATAGALSGGGGTTAASSPLVGLKAGALGNTVKQLQQAMLDAGTTVRGGADGIFGPATRDALMAFQRSQGLDATGTVDAATASALADPKPAASATQSGGSGGYATYGEKGTRVLDLQAALVRAGIDVRGGVDGDFGAGTSAAVMDYQRRKGLSVTGKVDDATGAALGLTKAPAPKAPDPSTVSMAVFPVQGACQYGDSWGYPRSGGRVHQGVDIIAPEGRLLYATSDGRITKVYDDYPGSLAGNGVRLTMSDGTYFFYAHMSARADGIELGVPVKAGQIIGYLGKTGNAGTSHLHFEIHPQGGAAVNPYPLVKAIDGCSITEPLPQP
jgi:peptidoglycan hydrolase-like protein with peptidoglycan-binding domain